MEREVSLDEVNGALSEFDALPLATQPPKGQKRELSIDEVNGMFGTPAKEERGFWSGVGKTIAGTFEKAGKGLQLEAAEYNAEDEENLVAYQRSLGEAQRNGNKKLEGELTQLIAETQGRIAQKNSAPAVVERVKQLQGQIAAINEDISGAKPQDMGFWKNAAYNAASSVGVMAPSLVAGVATGGATVPLTSMAMITYAGGYADRRSQGMSREVAARLSAVDGLAEAMTELLPTSRLLKNTKVFQKFLEATIADIPGEALAHYIQTATDEVSKLGDSPTDAQIKETLEKVAKTAHKELPSVAATTVMAGGAVATGVAGVQALGGKKEEAPALPGPSARGKQVRKKPHYKNPEEARKAQPVAPEAVSPGSEAVDLDELLAEATASGKVKGPNVPLDETQEIQIPAEEGTEFFDPGETVVLDLPEVPEDGKARGEIVDFDSKRKARDVPKTKQKVQSLYEQVAELDRQWVMEDIAADVYETERKKLIQQVEELSKQIPEKAPKPSKEQIDASIDAQLAEMKRVDAIADSPLSDEDLLALYQDTARRQRVAEFAGPAPTQPRPTGDKMADRRAETQFMQKLREWAGEFKPKTEGSVTPLRPRSISPTDKVDSRSTRLAQQLRNTHQGARPMWDLLGSRSGRIAKEAKGKGLDPSSATVVSAQQVLARLSAVADGAYKPIIAKLQEFVSPEQEIHFQWRESDEALDLPGGEKENVSTAGVYIGKGSSVGGGRIVMKVNEDVLKDSSFTKNILHELWHAVTYEYLANNPDSAVAQRIVELYRESFRAIATLKKELEASGMSEEEVRDTLGGDFWLEKDERGRPTLMTKDHLYGLTNHFELIAEALSSPAFMHVLAKASPRARSVFQRVRQIFHEVVGLIAEALGFNRADARLLHEIFDATDELLLAQKMRDEGGNGRRAAAKRVKVEAPSSQAFADWFKGSKVVDGQGKPLVMYHGTSKDKDFASFKSSPRGMWFTDNPETAASYAGSNDSRQMKLDRATLRFTPVNHADRTIPVFLSIKNPAKPSEADLTAMKFAGGGKGQLSSYREAQRRFFEKYRREGHDGVDFGDGVWVAFSPEQIKSAVGNKGTFSPQSGNILRSKAAKETSYNRERQLKPKKSVENAVKLLTNAADKVPGVAAIRKKVDQYLTEVKRNIAPETLGPKASQSATILAKWIVNQMRNDASFEFQSKDRRDFWEKNAAYSMEFIKAFEGGWVPKDPAFREIAQAYREWNERIMKEDLKKGITYDAQNNYLYHIFKDHDKLSDYMQRKYGRKWGDPAFMKERSYDLYDEAIKAGFKPLYTNPEDIMLARQHSSEIAHMRIGALEELYQAGLAWEKKPQNVETVAWRSPAGNWYYVHHEAASVLHNAWNTESLWSKQGMVGDVFKGAMYLKNRLVPIKLSLSLFHFLHVLTINNATGMLRATKGLLLGNVNPVKWLAEMGKATFYTDLISSPMYGGRIRAVFRGEIPPDKILPHEALAIQYMIEGGMLPEQSHQYKSNAKVAFRHALLRIKGDPSFAGKTKGTVRAAYELPFAALDWMQHWMFEKWIPSIKTASYLKEVQTALESDPTLVQDQQRRQIVFHKLAKSVDNRHGEMVYKTMFWNKWIKDTAVVNLLSLGWQMGFIREYGGAIGDLKNLATKEGDLPTKIKAGQLDRPIFVSFYTAQALIYGGLLTWALSGEPPEEWKDYIYPKDGDTNPDGTPSRVNTMFYPREFAAIGEHISQDGLFGGLSHTLANKASGVYGLTAQAITGVDDFGAEFRNPHGTKVEKVAQSLDFVLGELTPISVGTIQREGTDPKTIALNVMGFSKAPGYATRGPAEAAIRHIWQKYNAKTSTPFERTMYSKDMRELRKFFEDGEDEKFGKKLDEMVATHELNSADRKRIRQNLRKGTTPEESMFQSLSWQQQKYLLDEMSEEDRNHYLPFSNKGRLRRRYISPDEVE